jgi:hypothetical protein
MLDRRVAQDVLEHDAEGTRVVIPGAQRYSAEG